MAKLTDKQKRFVQEYLVDLNATAAARRAGYSEKTANEQGARLLAKPNIQTAIQAAMLKRQKRVEITQDMVIMELAAIAFANGADFATITVNGLINVKPTSELSEEKRKALAGIKYSANGLGVEIKLHDKLRALELLGKHLGMFGGQTGTDDLERCNIFEAIDQSTTAELDISTIPEIEPPAQTEGNK